MIKVDYFSFEDFSLFANLNFLIVIMLFFIFGLVDGNKANPNLEFTLKVLFFLVMGIEVEKVDHK